MDNPDSRRWRTAAATDPRPTWLAAVLWRNPRLLTRFLRLAHVLRIANRAARTQRSDHRPTAGQVQGRELAGAAARAACSLGAVALLLSPLGPPPAVAGPGGAAFGIGVDNGVVLAGPDNLCSLHEAIHNANDLYAGQPYGDCAPGDPEGADVIVLPVGGEFVIPGSGFYDDQYGRNGLPIISSEVTLIGNGSTIRRDQESAPFRLLTVAASGDLTLTDTTLSGGYAWYDLGASHPPNASNGGGILSVGRLTISGSRIVDNKAQQDGGGVAVLAGEAFIEDSDISSNYAGDGGGFVNQGQLTLRRSVVSDNRGYVGGGILNWGTLAVDETVFHHNRSSQGDGISHYIGSATIANSLFYENQGFSVTTNAGMVITGSTFTHNGAGIASSGPLSIINTTISGNRGRGLSVSYDTTDVLHSTITGNSAGRGGGVYVDAFYDYGFSYDCFAGFVRLKNSIISGNQADDGPEMYARVVHSMCRAEISVVGNIVGHDGVAGVTNVGLYETNLVPDAPLAAIVQPTLAWNGGPTLTHALPPGSPAIDRSLSEDCQLEPVGGVDQRGWLRNVDGDGQASDSECDVGAFEWQRWPFEAFAPVVGGGAGQ